MTRSAPRRGQGGYTLVELLLAMVVAGILAGAVYLFFVSGLDAASSRDSQARAQNYGRAAADEFARDVRQAVSPDGLAAPVHALSAASLEVWVDLNRRASVTTYAPKRVRYMVSGTQLVKQILTGTTWSTAEVLAEPVANGSAAVFTATTSAGVATTTPDQVATISMRLILGDRAGRKSTTTEFTTDATLRNRLS